MSSFIKQIYNEQIKIYVRKPTWVMYFILFALIIGIAAITQTSGVNDNNENWEQVLEQDNEQSHETIQNLREADFSNEASIKVFEQTIERNNYRLENDIAPNDFGAWAFVEENVFLLSLVSLFTIIVAAGIIANEFKWGTIKLLLIRPLTRTQILLTKYISVLLFALWTLLFVWVSSLIVGMIFFGFEGFTATTVVNRPDGVQEVSLFSEVMRTYGFRLVNLVMMATFAFMISAIFRQSSLAIGLAIFLMFTGNTIVEFFANRDWAKYILFANTNLQQFSTGNIMFEGMTLGFSITMLIVYFVLFLTLAWTFFTKRDVAGE
ncbi:ABC transporter permease [Alkalibacillus haloalkaliphilus]|uniref:ABC transporter permease n=1 Tax=Alkalibacillus haloalkaliphilus TaxID=94136 RepID=UPI0002D55874|nr:ABC transporter permease [Alkalibacillus haloalkaliphilus]